MKPVILKPVSDMASIKIFSKEFSSFFGNEVGDGTNTVIIYNERSQVPDKKQGRFLGHFSVKKNNSVFLSNYDCADDPIYTFSTGRWFVNCKDMTFLIERIDNDTHA